LTLTHFQVADFLIDILFILILLYTIILIIFCFSTSSFSRLWIRLWTRLCTCFFFSF